MELGRNPEPDDMDRDAVHIATIPITAQERLVPGQPVGIDGTVRNPVGIVDPFLENLLEPGDRFYLCLYPNTVTSLKHNWTHPAFENEIEESKKWLEEFARELSITYNTLIRLGTHGGYEHVGSNDDAVDIFYQAKEEFNHHFKVVTGKNANDDIGFSCAC